MTLEDLSGAERHDWQHRVGKCLDSGVSLDRAEETAWAEVLQARVDVARARLLARTGQRREVGWR